MTDVEKIALWFGLIASIVSIVLSIVAIVFAILVDKSARAVSAQTIKSLQKIESEVERLSDDTRELIKAGWDKMLGSVDREPQPRTIEVPAKEIAAGIASELRAELSLTSDKGTTVSAEQNNKFEQLLETLETSLTAQLRAQNLSSRPSEALDRLINTLNKLSPSAQALLRAISNYHLSLTEYRALNKGPLKDSLIELRESGLLVPVKHETPDGGNVPCYYFPSSLSSLVKAAIPLIPKPPDEVIHQIKSELEAIGYPVKKPRGDGHKHS
jgi:hypothetical protein